ncbi:MAG: hypothetical protein U5M23_05850 [Marinagarivorans sp.]|nr:hypothetical protein [Marinagarivorans sp.]
MNSGIFKVFCIPKVFVVVGISVIISACAGDQNLNGEVDGEPEMGLEMMPETGIMPEPEMIPESEPEPEPETGMMPEPEMMPDKMDPLGLKAIVRSKGCGMPASSAKGQWVQQPTLKIGNRNRNWHVRLPDNYDPNRAYPLTFEFHGCGSKTNNIADGKSCRQRCYSCSRRCRGKLLE